MCVYMCVHACVCEREREREGERERQRGREKETEFFCLEKAAYLGFARSQTTNSDFAHARTHARTHAHAILRHGEGVRVGVFSRCSSLGGHLSPGTESGEKSLLRGRRHSVCRQIFVG